jgi:hypothetical protein
MATYYKYAERDAESQVNWASVGKDMSDMLAETNRVREEKKSAIDAATRESLIQLSNSPQGEHKGANTAALEYADGASNFIRLQDNLLKRGQLNLRDYTINRQNLNDGTDKGFNAMKAYQENYANKMKRYRDDVSGLYELRKMEQAEGFGNFTKAGLFIAPNGRVMAGMKTEKEVDGKKVFVMDDAPGKTASVDWINGMIVGEWNKYDYKSPIKTFVDGLGEEIKVALKLGGITRQGSITSISDITSRVDIDPKTKQELFRFITAENDSIQAVLGTPFDKLSVLLDSAKIARKNGKSYDITQDPEEAKKNPNLILEVINPNTGQGDMVFTDEQTKDAEDFIRGQMRAQYDYKEDKSAVNAVSRDEESEASKKRKDDQKEKDNALGTWGDVFKSGTPADKKAAIETIVGSQLSQSRGLLDIDTTVPGKLTFKYADAVKNRTVDYNPDTITLRQWNELGNEVHGIDNVAETMKRNNGGNPDMRMGAAQKDFSGVKAGRTAVQDPVIEFSNKVSVIKGAVGEGIAYMKDKQAAAEIRKIIEGTGIEIVRNSGANPFNAVTLKIGDKTHRFPVGYDPDEEDEAETAAGNAIEWIEANTPAATKKTILTKAGSGNASQYN